MLPSLLLLLLTASSGSGSLVNVFSRGESTEYYCFKIPDLVVLESGKIIAFAEARIGSCGDYTTTDLVYKVSSDNGETWSALRVLYGERDLANDDTHIVIGNAAPVQLRGTGRLLVPFCRNNHDVLLMYSDDEGSSWSSVVEVPSLREESWKWIGLGPPSSLQLSSGRIVIPAYHSHFHYDDGELSHSHIGYSDDLGKTWFLGGELGGLYFSNECQVVELPEYNNSLLMNARALLDWRLFGRSFDGGLTWGRVEKRTDLVEPYEGCEGSMIRHPKTGALFFSNPSNSSILRYGMTVKISTDGRGETWRVLKRVDMGRSGYSALAVLRNGSVAILYERDLQHLIVVPNYISFEVVWSP